MLNDFLKKMRADYKYISLLLIPFVIVGYTLPGSNSSIRQAKELISVSTFPSLNDDIFIRQPLNMAFDSLQNIYISDHLGAKILKFDKNGSHIRNIGRKGKGPGEFTMVSEIRVEDEYLYAYDQGRFQKYKLDGTFLESNLIFGIKNYWVHRGSIFAYKLEKNPRDLLTEDGYNEKLFKVLNQEGKKIDEFGSFLDLMPAKNSFQTFRGSDLLLREYNHRLYVLFRYFPVLRVYDLNTNELIKEITFDHPFDYASDRVNQNYLPESYIQNGTMRVTFLFSAFDVTDDGIFVGLFDDDILIDQYDFGGNHINRYWKGLTEGDYYLYDLGVKRDKERRLNFYALTRKNGIPLVEVLTHK